METYCKVKAADGYTYYMAEALLDKVLGKLEKKKARKHMKFWKPTREQTWNTKHTSRFLHVQERQQQNRKRKLIS